MPRVPKQLGKSEFKITVSLFATVRYLVLHIGWRDCPCESEQAQPSFWIHFPPAKPLAICRLLPPSPLWKRLSRDARARAHASRTPGRVRVRVRACQCLFASACQCLFASACQCLFASACQCLFVPPRVSVRVRSRSRVRVRVHVRVHVRVRVCARTRLRARLCLEVLRTCSSLRVCLCECARARVRESERAFRNRSRRAVGGTFRPHDSHQSYSSCMWRPRFKSWSTARAIRDASVAHAL